VCSGVPREGRGGVFGLSEEDLADGRRGVLDMVTAVLAAMG